MFYNRTYFKVLTIFFLGFFPICLIAKTITVAPKTQYATLKAAVAVAKNGDTIIVKKGIYPSHNTIIDKQLTILGQEMPVLDAQFKEEVITIKANHVTLDGFVIQNSKVGDLRDFAGIRVFQAKHITISNNLLKNNFFGIYISDAHKVNVINNKLVGTFNSRRSGNGVQAWKSDSVEVVKNHITGHRDGIYFEFVQHSKVYQNLTDKNMRYGLHFMFSNDNIFLKNIFKNNQAGIAVMYSKRIKMLNNQFNENWGSSIYGLLLKEILDSQIEGNTFHKNTSAIFMESCSRNKIIKNSFLNNGWGLRILSNCQDNVFSINNFKGNTFDVTTNGELLENKFKNNYWDKYEGYDLNKDGKGDVPYRPISLYAQIIERVPQSVILMRSFIVNLLDKVERSIPSITPLSVKDDSPQMKPWNILSK